MRSPLLTCLISCIYDIAENKWFFDRFVNNISYLIGKHNVNSYYVDSLSTPEDERSFFENANHVQKVILVIQSDKKFVFSNNTIKIEDFKSLPEGEPKKVLEYLRMQKIISATGKVLRNIREDETMLLKKYLGDKVTKTVSDLVNDRFHVHETPQPWLETQMNFLSLTPVGRVGSSAKSQSDSMQLIVIDCEENDCIPERFLGKYAVTKFSTKSDVEEYWNVFSNVIRILLNKLLVDSYGLKGEETKE